MAYGPRFSRTEFIGGKNILASEHFENVKGGATLDATEFPVGHNEVGLLIARDTSTGKFVPYKDDGSVVPEGVDTLSVLNIDFDNDGKQDLVVGEVIVRGSVYKDKLPEAPTDAFKAAAPMIQFISHKKS